MPDVQPRPREQKDPRSAAAVRKSPCRSCPYRRDVPSGVWAPEEYRKLPTYDGSISEQAQAGAVAAFHCHSSPDCVCAGWAGHRDPRDLLAVRYGVSTGSLDLSVADYATDVPLFGSGAEAAAHGLRDVDTPGDDAVETIDKLTRAHPRLRKD